MILTKRNFKSLINKFNDKSFINDHYHNLSNKYVTIGVRCYIEPYTSSKEMINIDISLNDLKGTRYQTTLYIRYNNINIDELWHNLKLNTRALINAYKTDLTNYLKQM